MGPYGGDFNLKIEKNQDFIYYGAMVILAIETSCDDTGIAILEAGGEASPVFSVLSNIVSSQTEIHRQYGGVFPMMAKREHQRNLVPVLAQALTSAKLANYKSQDTNSKLETVKKILEKEHSLFEQVKEFLTNYERPTIDAIAVTFGPGLEPCLYVGVNFAKALSYFWDIPLIPVNHIEAHILVNFLEHRVIKFPSVALVVSGGHTQIILVNGVGKYKILGETRDDAAGECFDKCAKMLGLKYPGGPVISTIASKAVRGQTSYKLPRPMINTNDYDFSFSGLKTAVLYAVKGKRLTKQYVEEMCVEIQQAIIDVLLKKTLQAAKDYQAKTIILGGGVSANSELRSQFKFKIQKQPLGVPAGPAKFKILFPEKNLSTDNGLMIAVAGYFHRAKKIAWQKVKVNANLRIS